MVFPSWNASFCNRAYRSAVPSRKRFATWAPDTLVSQLLHGDIEALAWTFEEVTTFGDGGRQPGQFYGVHSIATDSKGNIYTTETYEGKRLQKFVDKGIGTVRRGNQGVLWPRS